MQEMQQKVLEIVTNETLKRFAKLYTKWLKVYGHGSEAAFSKQLKDKFSYCMKNAVAEIAQKELDMLQTIKILNSERKEIEKQLGENLTSETQKRPLLKVIENLKIINDYGQRKLRNILKQYEIIQMNQMNLCDELNEPLEVVFETSLIKKESQIRNHVVLLSEMKIERNEIIGRHQLLARELVAKLGGLAPAKGKYRQMINEATVIQPTSENVSNLQLITFKLKLDNSKMVAKIRTDWVRLQSLWNWLGVPRDIQNLITKNFGFNYDTYLKVTTECENYEKLMLKRIPETIERLRSDIINFSQRCMKPDEVMLQSVVFGAGFYNEDAVRCHYKELIDIKSYYEQNETIFKLILERDTLKSLLKIIKQGQGLKLVELQSLERSLLKAEIALCRAVDDYATKKSSPFLVNNVEVHLDLSAESRLEKAEDAE